MSSQLGPLLGIYFFCCLPVAHLWDTESLVSQSRPDAEREKATVRLQFSKHFRDLQLVSQSLLRDHESGQLTAIQLAKKAKSINKSAKTLHSMMALGELAQMPELADTELSNNQKFDQSIRLLIKIVYDFSHSPHHKNSKIFDTIEAAKVQKELLTIISLSKVIETNAKNYNAGGQYADTPKRPNSTAN